MSKLALVHKPYNFTYEVERTEKGWELVILLNNFFDKEENLSGYLNLETQVLSLVCPEEQYDDIIDSFTPYIYESIYDVNYAILTLEMHKDSIIETYLFNYEVA